TEYDQYLGNWAVYASRDLYRDGQVLAAKGEKIAGSGFDSSKFGGNLFTVDADDNGKVTADATQAYLDLVSADNEHEAGWVLYLQCKRIAVADEVPNTWTETINGQPRESNKVVTKTPDMTPSIHLEKVDTPTLKQDGQEQADRDDPKQALKMDADNIGITFIITNTSKTDPATGDGAWYKASDLNLDDSTIVGDAHVDMDSLTYPDNWDTLVLKPGESVSVTGTLKGVKEGDTHTDRAIVTGTPLVECAPSNGDPFNDKTDGGEDTDPEYSTGDVTEIDGKQLCADTQTTSNTDDWNGYRAKPLASTGAAVLGLAGGALAVLLAGGSLLVFRKRHCAQGSGRHTAVNAGK
ncbi:LPXTG cell wall anchor domain-containing protein, partial [Bifidobacterium longum]